MFKMIVLSISILFLSSFFSVAYSASEEDVIKVLKLIHSKPAISQELHGEKREFVINGKHYIVWTSSSDRSFLEIWWSSWTSNRDRLDLNSWLDFQVRPEGTSLGGGVEELVGANLNDGGTGAYGFHLVPDGFPTAIGKYLDNTKNEDYWQDMYDQAIKDALEAMK